MGTLISMACYDTLNKAANKAGIADYQQAYSLYESGMIDMLTQIAVVRSLELDNEHGREYPPEYGAAVEEQSALLERIRDALPEEHKALIHDLESIDTQLQSIEMDDQFIRGFIEGYRYLRNLTSSYRGALLDVRK